jgi:hypothetical protein
MAQRNSPKLSPKHVWRARQSALTGYGFVIRSEVNDHPRAKVMEGLLSIVMAGDD